MTATGRKRTVYFSTVNVCFRLITEAMDLRLSGLQQSTAILHMRNGVLPFTRVFTKRLLALLVRSPVYEIGES